MTPRLRWCFGFRDPLPKWTGPVNVELRRQIEKLPPAVPSPLERTQPRQANVYVIRKPKTIAQWFALHGGQA